MFRSRPGSTIWQVGIHCIYSFEIRPPVSTFAHHTFCPSFHCQIRPLQLHFSTSAIPRHRNGKISQANCSLSRLRSLPLTMKMKSRLTTNFPYPARTKGKGRHILIKIPKSMFIPKLFCGLIRSRVKINQCRGAFAFSQMRGVSGNRAAATRRPSSASKLYVEHAFLCEGECKMPAPPTRKTTAYRVHDVNLNS